MEKGVHFVCFAGNTIKILNESFINVDSYIDGTRNEKNCKLNNSESTSPMIQYKKQDH